MEKRKLARTQDKGHSPSHRARSHLVIDLIRVLLVRGRSGARSTNICDPLADALLRGDIRDGVIITVSAADEGLGYGWTWKLSARKRVESEDPTQFF